MLFSTTTASSVAPRRGARALLAAPVVGALVGASLLHGAAPAGAAPVPVTDHAMGSTVAAHEGRAGTPALAADPRTGTSRLLDGAAVAGSTAAGTTVKGMDVSRWQGNVDWPRAWANGARFAYVKATEGTTYTNPYFKQQYNGSYGVGMIRGAYHFALPDRSSGTAQADWFVDHGGGWSPDGRTLPPLLDIEYNPYGSTCYGLSQASMVSWLKAFSGRVKARTGRYPAIYTTTNWWQTCTGNTSSFAATNPLFLARYSSTPGTLPAGWRFWTFWQFSDSGIFPGDQDLFNGSYTQLQTLSRG